MHPAGPRIARRTTLAGLLALGGCSWGRSPDATSGSAGGSSDQEYDQRLVDALVPTISRALSVIEVMAARFDLVAGRLAPLVAMHQAHLSVLGITDRPAAHGLVVPRQEAAALAALRLEEQGLQRELAAAATNARSGALARVLASMAAGVAQHLSGVLTTGAGS